MPLVATTVRFTDSSYEMVRDEAHDAGISVAQFVREAALMRAVIRATRRQAPGRIMDMGDIAAEVERLASVADHDC